MSLRIGVIGAFAMVLLPALRTAAAAEARAEFVPVEKPRVLVLTDISNEPDDEESLVRFLVYSNEYDVEGLIATTSVWLKDTVRPERIQERVVAYGQVRDNLLKHASGYPAQEHLRSVIKTGRPEFGMSGVGEGKSSDGSRHVIEVVDKPDKRPVWVCIWGGANCLAQALWGVKYTRSAEELDAFVSKLRASSGQRVNLSAAGTRDPDGNSVSYRWFLYGEAGTFRGDVRIEDAASAQAWFLAPQMTAPVSLHVILEVWDDGQPRLCSYRRIIVTIEGK